MKRLFILLSISVPAIAVMVYGCTQERIDSSDRIPEHTHLRVADRKISLWTYLTVAELRKANGLNESLGKHCDETIGQGDIYKLSDSTLITYDGALLKVGNTIIPEDTLNLFIDNKGNVHLGNFIRTFR